MRTTIAALAAAGLLAGCSGSSSAPAAKTPTASTAVPAAATSSNTAIEAACDTLGRQLEPENVDPATARSAAVLGGSDLGQDGAALIKAADAILDETSSDGSAERRLAFGTALLRAVGACHNLGFGPASITASPPPDVTTSDYTPTVKVLRKQCFGSAGCNVEVRVTLAAEASVQDIGVEVTVEITGDESGPTVQTVQVEGGQYTPIEVSLSTKSSKVKVTAKVTDVVTL